MNIRNTIIQHYKNFFDLHAKGIVLDEDDHLNIDWACDLVEKCFGSDIELEIDNLCNCHEPMTQKNAMNGNDECYYCGKKR